MNRTFISILLVYSLWIFPATAQRIAILSDIHVTPGNHNDSALKVAVNEINSSAFDAVILAGDLSNEGSDLQIKNVAEIISGIHHPVMVLPGNHENNWSQSATKKFNDIFGTDRFFKRLGNYIFIGVNCGPYMKMGDGHVKQEDLHWLDATLQRELLPDDRIISVNHYPIRENDIDNHAEYAAVLSKYPVVCHLNGHYHRWLRYDIGDMPGLMLRSLDMGKGNYGYSILEISPDWLHIYNKELGKSPEPRFALANNTVYPALKKYASLRTLPNPTERDGFKFRKVWTDSASIFSRITIDDKNIYTNTSTGRIKSISKNDGIVKWEVTSPDGAALFSRPVKLHKGLLSQPYSSGLLVLDSRTGKSVKDYKSAEAPYVADGTVFGNSYLQGGYKRFEARNPVNGKLKWRYDSINNYCQAAAACNGAMIVFGAWDTNLRALDKESGRELWKWNNGKSANMYSPGNVVPVIADDKVIIVAPDRYMTAIDTRTGKTIWRNNSRKFRESMGANEDRSIVYAKTMDGELVAVCAQDSSFRELWCVDLGLGYDHAPCPILEKDGVIYCGSRNGRVVAVDSNSHKVLWMDKFGNSEVNGFDADPVTGDIYFSLIEGTIWCISKQ